MGWGRVSPAPWVLPLAPDVYQGFVQAVVGLALVAPDTVLILHIGLLSVPVLPHRDFLLSWVVPLTILIIA